ncbi:MAG: ion transporter [Acidobacteria bacterium]|nr:ion transporter [Acidobacteriota bacterium]
MAAVADTLHAAFHRPETRIYRVVQGTVWVLIALSVVLLALEATPWGGELQSLDRVVLGLFALELVLRVGTYRPPSLALFHQGRWGRLKTHLLGRLRFCFRPLILVDLLTVMAVIPALRGLRALRLLRLLRTARIFRYHNPFSSLARAFQDNALLYGFALSILGSSVLLGGVSIYLIEGRKNANIHDLADGVWWALVTLTTVGFGDISPVSSLGRVVGGLLMVTGMFVLALFAGIVGRTLVNTVMNFREEQFRMGGHIDHVVICGYGAGARLLLDSVEAEIDLEQTPVMLFAPGERPEDVPPHFFWISGDPTKESELDKARLTHASAVILVGQRHLSPQQADANTILTAFTIRSYLSRQPLNAQRRRPLYVVAEILDAENVEHARTAGADEVIESTRLGFSLLTHAVTMPGTAAVLGRVALAGAHSIFVGRLPEDLAAPTPFGELARQLKERFAVLLIGVRDPASGDDELNPPDPRLVAADAQLIYLAQGPVLPQPEDLPGG